MLPRRAASPKEWHRRGVGGVPGQTGFLIEAEGQAFANEELFQCASQSPW